MKRVSYVSSSVSTMLVKKKFAVPTSVNGFITEFVAARATQLLPWLHLVHREVVLMVEMLVFHCF